MLFTEQTAETVHGLHRILIAAEGSEAEEIPAVFAESGARRSHHLDIVQKIVKALPGFHAVRALEPDIRGVDAAVEANAKIR